MYFWQTGNYLLLDDNEGPPPPQTVLAGTISSSAQVFGPTIQATISLLPGFIASGAQVFDVTVQPQPVTVLAGTISSSAQVFDVTIQAVITSLPEFISGGAQVFDVTIVVPPQVITPEFLSSGAQVFNPTITRPIGVVCVEIWDTCEIDSSLPLDERGPEYNVYPRGQRVRLLSQFAVGEKPSEGGTLTDPTVVKVQVMTPAGIISTYTYGSDGDLIKDDTGTYHIDVTLSTEGEWKHRWYAEDSHIGAAWDLVYAKPDAFG